MFEISVDVGGTFADFVVRDQQGRALTTKVPSSADNPVETILRGLADLARSYRLSLAEFLGQTVKFTHGTTVGINALLQGRGVKTALITTEGFRDALELRRSRLAEQWDFQVALPPVLVPRYLRIGLRERLDYRGVVLKPIESTQIPVIADFLRREKVEAVAVCLLFSCRNPRHEVEFKEQLQALLPQVFISLSSELSAQVGEYERTSTTVLNARLSPLLGNYLQSLKKALQENGLQVPVSIAQNHGGLTDLAKAGRRAVYSLFSGPAGGVIGGWALGREQGLADLVFADMGGTSFDVSLIKQGTIEVTPQTEIAGYPVQLPMIDIHTIGAGGGSIAWLDKGGMLRVGPESAGAEPGPACYGLGGREATITDAALILGLLHEEDFLGGRMILDRQLAYQVIEGKIAGPLGISVPEAAYAIYQVALSLMVDAVYLMTVKKGHDPRLFTLAAAGGALPMFATALAQGVGIQQVIIPDFAPVFCAQGLQYARFQIEGMRSVFEPLGDTPGLNWLQVVGELKVQADQELTRLGVAAEQREYSWSADLKYPDQHHEIKIAVLGDINRQAVCRQTAEEFHHQHHRLYGYSQPDKPLELVNLRLLARERENFGPSRPILNKFEQGGQQPGRTGSSPRTAQAAEWRRVYLRGAYQDIEVFRWRDLGVGQELQGPALIIKDYTSILLEETCEAVLDSEGNLRIRIGKDGGEHES